MNEVARAVERKFDRWGRTDGTEAFHFVRTPMLIVEDYVTLQRLLKEAAGLLRMELEYVAVGRVAVYGENRVKSFLAELPEGYGNG